MTQPPSSSDAPPKDAPVETVVVSPNGAPMVPTWLSPWIGVLTALATGLVAIVPEHTILYKICLAFVGLGASGAAVSAGWRK